MIRTSLLSFSLFLVPLLCGCSTSDFPTAPVSGVVMCEGKPVANAMVYFEPVGGATAKDAVIGKQGFAFTDSEGKFELATYDPGGADGAVVGNHRVRVGKGDAECECVMNEEIDLMFVEVKADQDNVFEIVLKKKTGKERPSLNDDDDEDE